MGYVSKETVVLHWWGREIQIPLSEQIRSDEGLTLETLAFNLFTVVNLPYQLS